MSLQGRQLDQAHGARAAGAAGWPALPLEEWKDTYRGLHMRAQIVGKTRLALAPMENHWWQVALYVTPRGLTTSTMYYGHRALEIELDLVRSEVVMSTSDGARQVVPLRAEPVADFFAAYEKALVELGVEARIWPVPVEMADAIPFPEQRRPVPYDADAVRRWWQAIAAADRVFHRFRGRFLGKCSPVHFWWGSFDLACTRFSGDRAPRHPGGAPNVADRVMREAYSHACISAGWWPGTVGGFDQPGFYAYAYPEPSGCAQAAVRPAECRYDAGLREWVLPYDAVRTAADPDAMLLEFLQATYDAAATLAGWDRAALERRRARDRDTAADETLVDGSLVDETLVDDALAASFPASDPPFWTLGLRK